MTYFSSDVNWTLTLEAARFKSRYKLSYADCYAAALAKSLHADLISGDKEFRPLEDEVNIAWVAKAHRLAWVFAKPAPQSEELKVLLS